MTPERWATVKAILAGALEQDSERRRAFVDEACGSDELLRKEVHSLLAQEERSNSFLGRPLLDSALNRLVSSYCARIDRSKCSSPRSATNSVCGR